MTFLQQMYFYQKNRAGTAVLRRIGNIPGGLYWIRLACHWAARNFVIDLHILYCVPRLILLSGTGFILAVTLQWTSSYGKVMRV